MRPYYEQDGITIDHGDCLEVIEAFELHWGDKPFDLLLTDPPYGLEADRDRHSQRHGWRDYGHGGWDAARQPAGLAAALGLCRHGIIWGGNYYASMLPARQGWLVWDKGQRDFSLADGELAWTSYDRALRILSIPRGRVEGRSHPTQKPEALILWSLTYAGRCEPVASVFDPFMGAGTILLAAKRLGMRAVGIEQDEHYCAIAAERLAQGALEFSGNVAGMENVERWRKASNGGDW
jgi:DNA modification methylase